MVATRVATPFAMKNGQMLLLVPEIPCDSNSKIAIACSCSAVVRSGWAGNAGRSKECFVEVMSRNDGSGRFKKVTKGGLFASECQYIISPYCQAGNHIIMCHTKMRHSTAWVLRAAKLRAAIACQKSVGAWSAANGCLRDGGLSIPEKV